MIEIKILSYHSAQRYAVRQTVLSAQRIIHDEHPDVNINIMELKDWFTIEQYTPILAAPSLVVNEKLVCAGRFPARDEVLGWLRGALAE
ncbi:MAG: hypothetical protein C3F13_16905 [Anaerolineales bacterium]|nr:thioredoxin family protein [Anaerolineae bacterium]PWB50149.1 MAG: hypothetical protein C3F13_16905 [Anaerolineales bacterium]